MIKATAILSVYTNDNPKIKPTTDGAEVTFELYHVSIDELREYMSKELTLVISEKYEDRLGE